MYIVLIVTMIFLVLLNYTTTHDLLSPGGLYCGVLLVSALYGLFWYDKWELYNYGIKTYFVIVLGAIIFSVVGWFVHYLFKRKTEGETIFNEGGICIDRVRGGILLIIELATAYFSYIYYGGSFRNLSNAIIDYRVASVHGLTTMPSHLSFLLSFCMVIGYFAGYAFINNLLLCKKFSVFWLLIFLLSIIDSLFGASRGGAVSIIVVAFGVYCVLYNRTLKKSLDIHRKRKFTRFIFLAAILGIVFFIASAKWLGRTMRDSPAYYFAIYLSAPLKNLDINIQAIDSGKIITGKSYTSINGLSLGNVGTVYTYEYIQGGVFGVGLISLVVGVLISILYETIKCRNLYSARFNIILILYAYLFYSVSMIIFGTTLITSIFSLFFLKIVAGMIILIVFLNLELKGRYIIYRRSI